jgi:hypothetical protein
LGDSQEVGTRIVTLADIHKALTAAGIRSSTIRCTQGLERVVVDAGQTYFIRVGVALSRAGIQCGPQASSPWVFECTTIQTERGSQPKV